MRKTLYTLNVDNYSPEITAITFPYLEYYAKKIGAEFHIIQDRRWPFRPPVYEKLQIFSLGEENHDDWSIYIDADALVHPDLFDPTEFIKKDTVMHRAADLANNRWRYDKYFQRDGRHIGSCNWFTIASDWCRDLWRPLDDLTYEQALEMIYTTQREKNAGIVREHLIDDFILSRNIAKFGLKFKTLIHLMREIGDEGDYLWHQYLIPTDQKVDALKTVLENWNKTEV